MKLDLIWIFWELRITFWAWNFPVWSFWDTQITTCTGIYFSNTHKKDIILRFWHKCYKFQSVNQLTLIQLTAEACYSLTAFPAVRRESKIQCPFKVFGNVAKHRLQCLIYLLDQKLKLRYPNTVMLMISFLQNWVKMS